MRLQFLSVLYILFREVTPFKAQVQSWQDLIFPAWLQKFTRDRAHIRRKPGCSLFRNWRFFFNQKVWLHDELLNIWKKSNFLLWDSCPDIWKWMGRWDEFNLGHSPQKGRNNQRHGVFFLWFARKGRNSHPANIYKSQAPILMLAKSKQAALACQESSNCLGIRPLKLQTPGT